MKKILLFAVALALPLLFACNKDKNADPGASGIPTGGTFSNAGSYLHSNMWVSFNGDGTYIAGSKTPFKDIINDFYIMWGGYEYADGVYTLYEKNTPSKLGTIKDLGKGKVWVKIGAFDGEVPVTVSKPSGANENQRAANHTWTPVSLTLVYGAFAYNSINNVDLNAVENWAVEQKIIEKSTFKENMVMQKVFLSDTRLGLLFANGEEYVAEFDSTADLSNFMMTKVAIKDAKGDMSFFEGQTSIAFSWGKCIISIAGKYNSKPVSVVLTLAL